MQNQIVIEQRAEAQQMSLFEIENHSRQLIDRIDRLKDEAKQKREMIKNSLENDSDWSEISEQIKELQRKKKDIESGHSEIIELKEDIKELNGERKEVAESLSTYLEAYHTKSGKTEINDSTGEERVIKKQYRVK